MMFAPLLRALAVFAMVIACAVQAAADEPPSTAWAPPATSDAHVFAAPGIAAEPTTPEPTPAADELPAPAEENIEPFDPTEAGPLLLEDATDAVEFDEADWYRPTRWFGHSPWDTGIELGLNGSTGNNESFSIRTGGYLKRESRFSKLDYSIYYNRTTTGEITTQNNASSDIRNDWTLDDTSPWTLYAKGNVFYDEFQSFDLQTNANTGLGYRIFKDPVVNLTTRFGGGASREFGGPDNEWTPEALFGFEYDQKVNDTQKFVATFEYYPEFADFGKYRMVADGGWEIELVQPSNVSLKISANDRFDSTPNDANAHLVNYSVLLLIKL
jgi:putative salt-induced outer membrane protein YdiY